MMPYRFHVPGLPHTVTTPEFSSCAFTTKVVKLCKMLKAQGHTVIHYGHQDSVVDCDEHVTLVKRYDYDKTYKDWDWRKSGWPRYNFTNDWAYKVFYSRGIAEIGKRKQAGDFLCCPFGFGHKPLADAHKDLIICEPGIGYPTGGFAPYRVFESNSILSAYQGQKAIEWAKNDFWYDTVIPNYFDLEEFPDPLSPELHEPRKSDYFLFVGRVNAGKGIHIAEQLANKLNTRLIVAGAGEFTCKPNSKVERVGVVSPVERAKLMTGAHALLCPSTYMEPFCGVQVEAFLCGTPVISSDWGAFCEYNPHGVTGYRCKTFEHFEWAARNIGNINPRDCRKWGERFSIENIALMYEEFWFAAHRVFEGRGWYGENPERRDLKHTTWNGTPVDRRTEW